MDMTARLEALAALPKPHHCVVRYEDGKERRVSQPFLKQAENIAERERRKIGRDLIDRMTGETVRVVAVEVVSDPQ